MTLRGLVKIFYYFRNNNVDGRVLVVLIQYLLFTNPITYNNGQVYLLLMRRLVNSYLGYI